MKHLEKLEPLKNLVDGLKNAGLQHKNVHYEWIEACVGGLFERSPYKEGDRVTLIKTPDLSNAPGWKSSAHYLIPGSPATVKTVEFDKKGFYFLIEFDNESWITTWGEDKGKINKVHPNQRHVYGFRENLLRKL